MRAWPALLLRFPAAGPGAGGAASLPDLVAASLDGLDVMAVLERPDGAWEVGFRDELRRTEAARLLLAWHGRVGLRITRLDLPDGDWARRSQASLRAVRVGGIRVAPPWAQDDDPAGPGVTVVIEPAMGFGTGHHATTRLCLAALQRLDCRRRRVLDVGTGSGVLAFAACALGAREALGVDSDADAIENARGNAELNAGLPAVRFEEADFRSRAIAPADIVLANLTGALLMSAAGALTALVAPGGTLVVSGFTPDERPQVLAAFAPWGEAVWQRQEDGWCAAMVRGGSARYTISSPQ
ncbi:MAG TPA: 50S ribosomal protein L11 methyltransferase [Vicinamibacterales bacterium]|nr:50S ribosomal protein L11 methyltransferase [Vicinamibacterales bacterium]